jgi:hypothetical protein
MPILTPLSSRWTVPLIQFKSVHRKRNLLDCLHARCMYRIYTRVQKMHVKYSSYALYSTLVIVSWLNGLMAGWLYGCWLKWFL